MPTDNKEYTKHDLEIAQRLTSVEGKIDNLSNVLEDKLESMHVSIKEIKRRQEHNEIGIKDVGKFLKNNYKLVLLLLVFFFGSDALRQTVVSQFGLSDQSAQHAEKDKSDGQSQ